MNKSCRDYDTCTELLEDYEDHAIKGYLGEFC
jgi:hypothetical protein